MGGKEVTTFIFPLWFYKSCSYTSSCSTVISRNHLRFQLSLLHNIPSINHNYHAFLKKRRTSLNLCGTFIFNKSCQRDLFLPLWHCTELCLSLSFPGVFQLCNRNRGRYFSPLGQVLLRQAEDNKQSYFLLMFVISVFLAMETFWYE